MVEEFKAFVLRGNVVDLAVGIIIGAAFTGVVNSLVNDLLMPPLGYIIGGVDFSNIFIALDGTRYPSLAAARAAGAATINIGAFANAIITFLITALAMFLVVKQMNLLMRKKPAAAITPTTKSCPYCFSTIPLRASRCPNCTSQLELPPSASVVSE